MGCGWVSLWVHAVRSDQRTWLDSNQQPTLVHAELGETAGKQLGRVPLLSGAGPCARQMAAV